MTYYSDHGGKIMEDSGMSHQRGQNRENSPRLNEVAL